MSIFFLNVFILVLLFYLLQTILFLIGSKRLNYTKTTAQPKISILVALRDEENSVRACVNSLLKQNYPRDKLEIILVNDRSNDLTAKIIDAFKNKSPLIKTLHLRQHLHGLSGKASAVAQGVEHCTGELILITDGDCCVPPQWAKTHASYYTKDVGMVGGFTLLDDKNDDTSFFGKIQSLDWAYLLSVGTAAIGLGIPLSILGNNFSFRKAAYDAAGGFRNMGFTIIEDFALMKALLNKTMWQVRYPIHADMLVKSLPMPDVQTFFQQRKRWAAGGKEVGMYGKCLMLISTVTHILLPVSFFYFDEKTIPIVASALIFLSDFLFLRRTTGKVNRRDLLNFFFPWEFFYFFYTIFFTPVLLLPTTVTWKGISYEWKFNWQLKRMFVKTTT